MKDKEKVEEQYNISVLKDKKKWHQLSPIEKQLFEFLDDNLNGDRLSAGILAVRLYKEVLEPFIQEREREAVEEFVERLMTQYPEGMGMQMFFSDYVHSSAKAYFKQKESESADSDLKERKE